MESLTCGKVNTPTDAFLPTIMTHQQELSLIHISFTVNEEGLPEIVEHTPEKEEGDKQPSRFTYQDLTSEQHNRCV